MTCACESIHPFPCQFEGETEFFSFDGKEWCRFHLPLQDAAGNSSAKGRGDNGWEAGGTELEKFTGEIHARLRTATPWDGNPENDTRTDLRGVTFPPSFGFTSIADVLHVNFERAVFGNKVDFTAVKFGNNTNFKTSKFGNIVSFEGAIFEGVTDFMGTIFGDQVRFTKTIFKKKVDFSVVGAIGSVADSNFYLRRIRFSYAVFEDNASFENRRFDTTAWFNGVTFMGKANFHGCIFHQGMSFRDTNFLKTKGKKDSDTAALERSYRTLKLEMEKLRARNEEADFFALEMECRRQRGSVPPFERFAATLYKHLSDYGRSVDLPLIWLLVLAYAAHYLYLGVAMIGCNPGPGARLAFTLEQMFRPFFVWAKGAPGTGNCLVENFPLLIPFLASLQSLGAIGLLTLFLLALRRRFKMD